MRNNVADLTAKTGSRLLSAGYGLETISALLGADDLEHHLTPDDLNGLSHAVSALADLIKDDAFNLCELAAQIKAEEKQGVTNA